MDVTEVLAENASRLRRERGLSQRSLAKIAGLTQPAISDIERGGRDPQLGTLERLADALGVSVADLLVRGEEDPKDRAPRSGRPSDRFPGEGELPDPMEWYGPDGPEAFVQLLRPVIDEAVREALAERERRVPQEQR